MTKSRVLSAGLIAGALALAPMSSALAGGTHWSHGGSYHAPAYHGGYNGGYHGGYHGAYGHGGGGYWHGGVWWPAAAAAASGRAPPGASTETRNGRPLRVIETTAS